MFEIVGLYAVKIAALAANGAGAYLLTATGAGAIIGAGGVYFYYKDLTKKPEPVIVPWYRQPFNMFKKQAVPPPTTYWYDFWTNNQILNMLKKEELPPPKTNWYDFWSKSETKKGK